MSVIDAFGAAVHTPAIEFTVRWDDVAYTDETAYVESANGVESMDDLGLPHAAEVTLVLDNASGRYTPGNTASPIYAWTADLGQRARVRLGYDPTTTGGWETVGTYRVRDISIDPGERTATFTLSDAVADYAETLVGLTATENLALSSAASQLIASAGLAASDFAIDGSLAGTATFAYATKATLLSELWQIAIAAGGRVYVDELGVLRLDGRDTRRAALRSPVTTLYASQVVYRQAATRRSDRPNRVVLQFDDRTSAGSAEPIWVSSAPITIPPAYSATVRHLKSEYATYKDATGTAVSPPINITDNANYTTTTYFYAPALMLTIKPEDRIQWKANVPIDYGSLVTTLTANTAANGGGTVLATADSEMLPTSAGTTVYFHTYPPSWTRSSNLMLWLSNDYPGTAFVTAGTISAGMLRREGAYGVIASDTQALAENGGRVVERQVASAYLPDAATTQSRAADLLALLSASRAAIDIPELDGVPFLHVGDAFAYVDDTVTPAVTYDLQVLENRWTYGPAGYTASIVTMPSLGATDRGLATAIPAPTCAAGTVVRTGPFRWGASGTALYWSQSSWG